MSLNPTGTGLTRVRRSQKKEVSEKSLELNVCAEMLQYIRTWPGCKGALWEGLTQRQESIEGLDERIRNVPDGCWLMLQFKSPWPTSTVNLYKFSINEKQHKALELMANQYPKAVFYVFPLYSTWRKADKHAPDLLQDTWLSPVSRISLISLKAQSTPASGRHRVELDCTNSPITMKVHSPEIMGRLINAKKYFLERDRDWVSDTKGFGGVPSEYLREWIDPRDQKSSAPSLRGLHALYLPRC